jgi:hypothetical protein
MRALPYRRTPCDECPWVVGNVGQFPAERFARLAVVAHDQSWDQFACHKSSDGADVGCAGYLLRGAAHNLGVRLAVAAGRLDPAATTDGGRELYPSYRAMAEAQGVPADHPALRECR